MKALLERLGRIPQLGLIGVIVLLGAFIAAKAGTRVDPVSHLTVNGFLNAGTIVQLLKDTSFTGVMAVGIAFVIMTGGIDLSVGSTYALSGVFAAMSLRAMQMQHATGPTVVLVALGLCTAIGLVCGLLNGAMVVSLGVHPFVITLGMMWVFRGVSNVASKAESILMPEATTNVIKASLGLRSDLYPVPFLIMVLAVVIAGVYLAKTVPGRNVYAVGGNLEASSLAGIRVSRVLLTVYALCGLCAGLAAFLGASYYGSASCADGQGYELYAIAAAVVGGVSLKGGRGTVFGAALGALLISLFRQAVVTLHLDTNYEWIIIGIAIVVAVSLERLTRLRERE